MVITVTVIGQDLGLSHKAMRVIRTHMATAGPFPHTGLVKKTRSPCCHGEDSLNKPSTTWGLGFYIQRPCAWVCAEAGSMQTNAC